MRDVNGEKLGLFSHFAKQSPLLISRVYVKNRGPYREPYVIYTYPHQSNRFTLVSCGATSIKDGIFNSYMESKQNITMDYSISYEFGR